MMMRRVNLSVTSLILMSKILRILIFLIVCPRYGQLSGMVEPVFGVLGAVAVAAAQPALPYALAFAAGAMIYVVADDIIPEANAS